MPRDGKFNKRGAGPRLDAQNADEIELRNARLAEFEEARTARRDAEDDDDDDDEDGDNKKSSDKKSSDKKSSDKKSSEAKGAASAAASSSADVPDTSSKPRKVKVGGDDAPPAPVTTEADHNRNLAKLAEVRRRREVAEARRQMDEEAERAQEEERLKLVQLSLDDGDDDKKKKNKKKPTITKLDKIAIKKMKPAIMKEALKERGLEIQGNAKELQDRLIKYEAER